MFDARPRSQIISEPALQTRTLEATTGGSSVEQGSSVEMLSSGRSNNNQNKRTKWKHLYITRMVQQAGKSGPDCAKGNTVRFLCQTCVLCQSYLTMC